MNANCNRFFRVFIINQALLPILMIHTINDSSNTLVKWLKVNLLTPAELSEAAADLMGVLSGSAVEQTPDSEACCTISGFFQVNDDNTIDDQVQTITEQVSDQMSELFSLYNKKLVPVETEIFDDEHWATSWQQFFSPFEIIPGMVIKPSWEAFKAKKGEVVIEMDPGMAFGTGQHASTQMALSLLAECATDQVESILDIGTGTGILTIAGCLLGVQKGLAIDNDPDAVTAATENVAKNGLESKIAVSQAPLHEMKGTFPIICANIVHDVLVEMAPEITRLIRQGGSLILAGILKGEQEINITKVYHQLGFELLETKYQDEWAALLFKL